MLISTEAAGSQGTSGTEKDRAEGSWGCLWMTIRQRNILTRIMMMIILRELLEVVEVSTDKGMQRRVKRRMEWLARLEVRGVGATTWSRLRHCLRYCLLLKVYWVLVLLLQE